MVMATVAKAEEWKDHRPVAILNSHRIEQSRLYRKESTSAYNAGPPDPDGCLSES